VVTTRTRPSRLAASAAIAAVASLEPSSMTMHSHEGSVWRQMLSSVVAIVAAAFHAGRTIETRGGDGTGQLCLSERTAESRDRLICRSIDRRSKDPEIERLQIERSSDHLIARFSLRLFTRVLLF
jgi:hypothetical protein